MAWELSRRGYQQPTVPGRGECYGCRTRRGNVVDPLSMVMFEGVAVAGWRYTKCSICAVFPTLRALMSSASVFNPTDPTRETGGPSAPGKRGIEPVSESASQQMSPFRPPSRVGNPRRWMANSQEATVPYVLSIFSFSPLVGAPRLSACREIT